VRTSQSEQVRTRILIETLRESKNGGTVRIDEVASRAGASADLVREVLRNALESPVSSKISPSSETRFRLAFEAARNGGLRDAARVLTWQEFEKFAEECLAATGFQTTRGLMVTGETRRWQIDLVAMRGPMMLVFDCKHWNSPSYPSKFESAAEHQRLATMALIRNSKARESFAGKQVWALPIILTLFDPRIQLTNGVVLLSIDKLADFLNGVTHYSDLPFISDGNVAENPIR